MSLVRQMFLQVVKSLVTSKQFGKINPLSIAAGYRSGLEQAIAKDLEVQGVDYRYEEDTFNYVKPSKASRYTPDFILPNGIIIESKGRFLTADRQKHLMIQKQHPELEIRFVFDQPKQRISKGSKTTYAMWCIKNSYMYAQNLIPPEWLEETVNTRWLEAIKNCRRD